MTEPTTADSPPTIPHGPFRTGDRVQLTDPKGRVNTIILQAGKVYHSHKGSIPHDEIIGSPEGTVFRSTGGTDYLAFRPLLADYALRMPRGAAVVYPKDAAQIVAMADVFPGARVVEAGARPGAPNSPVLPAGGARRPNPAYEGRPGLCRRAAAQPRRF